jgi:Fic family protein
LTLEILLDIHNRLQTGFSGRAENPDPANLGAGSGREPAQANLAVACHWWTADSFLELHPVEQAAIVHLRLTDLRPFGQLTGRASLIASSLFLIRAEMPPVIVPFESVAAYRRALTEAGLMNTQPTVELFAQLTEHSLGEMIRLATTR